MPTSYQFLETYLSRYNSVTVNVNTLLQPCELSTPVLLGAISFIAIGVNMDTTASNWSISQTGHDSHGCKTRDLSTPVLLGAISLSIVVNTDTSKWLINISNRTARFTRLQNPWSVNSSSSSTTGLTGHDLVSYHC